MAYFKSNEPLSRDQYPAEEETEQEYNDGFDELTEEEEYDPEPTEEERRERRESRLRLAMGAGNLMAVIAGAVLILVLLTLIFSMVYFVIKDMGRNFSLFSTNF